MGVQITVTVVVSMSMQLYWSFEVVLQENVLVYVCEELGCVVCPLNTNGQKWGQMNGIQWELA